MNRLLLSRVWSIQWFCFQWLWVTLNHTVAQSLCFYQHHEILTDTDRCQGHGVIFMPTDAFNVLCAQLTRDLLAIAKFLFLPVHHLHSTPLLNLVVFSRQDRGIQSATAMLPSLEKVGEGVSHIFNCSHPYGGYCVLLTHLFLVSLINRGKT